MAGTTPAPPLPRFGSQLLHEFAGLQHSVELLCRIRHRHLPTVAVVGAFSTAIGTAPNRAPKPASRSNIAVNSAASR
ncbi:hypothetical protein [Plantactinospora mayteni]|uniref:hypothetical protein n=1 Tax=Plantactinospora mayteni TaxID=566021 RepID=UPI00194390E2|nr:hypothetical protein [Plantactinospora mayteni]